MSQKKTCALDKFFGYTAKGSNLRTEIMAGITTFFAMAYILMVNADMFTATGVPYGAIYIATAISAVVGTLAIGLLANLPLAQASGMGLNAFFVYTCCLTLGMSYANALVLVLFDGILFIVLTVTGLRKMIFQAIPSAIRVAIPAGIGLFIAFLGLQNAGIVVADSSTGVTLGSFNLLTVPTITDTNVVNLLEQLSIDPATRPDITAIKAVVDVLGKLGMDPNALTSANILTYNWFRIMPMVVTLIALFAIAIMSFRKVKGSVLLGILGGTVLYYLLGFVTIPNFGNTLSISMSSPFEAFKAFGTESFGKVFTEGFDFSAFFEANGTTNAILTIATTTLAFCMVDMFDTIGTLYGACARGNMLTEEGDIPNMDKAMLADAIATTTGAICGTSTVTTFVESSAGVAEGGRTGMSAMVTAALFFIAMFLAPVAQLIPGCATAAALVYVGVLMVIGVKNINWEDATEAVPAFLTMAMMPFTYNISYGICFGLISCIAIKACTGKIKDIKIGTYIIAALFLAMLLLTH